MKRAARRRTRGTRRAAAEGRGRRRLAAGLAGLSALVLALAAVDPPHPPAPAVVQADAALVLSGDVDYLRVKRAAGLYRAGAVGHVVVTGAGVGGDGAVTLAAVAEDEGVPRERLLLEKLSRSTYENLAFAAPLLLERRFSRVALVTSASHLCRAERVARRVLPAIEWQPVAVPDPGPPLRDARNRLLEWAKLAVYAARGFV